MQKSNVVIFYDYFLPAYKAGGPIQSISNLIEQTSENINYKIVTSNKDLDNKILMVKSDTWVKYNASTDVFYSSGRSSGIKKNINRDHHDILFINGIYSFKYNLIPLLFYKAKRKIISARGMLHPGALSQKAYKKKVYITLLKLLSIHKKYEFHASNFEEKKNIELIFGNKSRIHIAENFPKILPLQHLHTKIQGYLNLISVGLISPMKNYLLVLKALQFCVHHINYTIYGPIKDENYWGYCKEQIIKLPQNITVKYMGDTSPDDIINCLAQSHVFILPSKSENFGHAIYEALSAGRPVITSKNTPWNNLQSSMAGKNISLDNTVEISEAIDAFAALHNDDLKLWSIGANNYATQAININSIKAQYTKMFAL